ncbi:MAG: 50S ribosomal protein L30 [Candidatus Omnitrophica bacterium]|nr:50S ribosomal protein L30 [Candidatus Omnitrophota bacterium]
MAKKLEITLTRSLIGKVPKHQRTAKALGLRKMNRPVVVADTPATRGMVNAINYLVSVREIEQ